MPLVPKMSTHAQLRMMMMKMMMMTKSSSCCHWSWKRCCVCGDVSSSHRLLRSWAEWSCSSPSCCCSTSWWTPRLRPRSCVTSWENDMRCSQANQSLNCTYFFSAFSAFLARFCFLAFARSQSLGELLMLRFDFDLAFLSLPPALVE